MNQNLLQVKISNLSQGDLGVKIMENVKPRILITEDDIENQRFLKMFLGRNFITDICDSDISLYEHLNSREYDVILMDISLKGNKNGLELTRELKSNFRYKNIPIVCLTAHAFKKDYDNAMKAGVDIFLTKPIDNHILLQTLLDAEHRKNNIN